jgi:hypothetical protein
MDPEDIMACSAVARCRRGLLPICCALELAHLCMGIGEMGIGACD